MSRGHLSRIIKGISKLALTSQQQLPFCCAEEFSRSGERQKQGNALVALAACAQQRSEIAELQKLSRARALLREQKKPKLCHGKGELIYVSINCTLDARLR
jgi:hypothetical protein